MSQQEVSGLEAGPAAAGPADPPVSSSRRNVLLWVIGTGVSVSGDAALSLALSVWMKDLTDSNGAAGLAFLAFLAPRLLTPFTAILADRLPRRPLVVVLNLLLAGWVCIALLVHDKSDAPLLYVVLFGVGLGTGLHHATGGALLTRLVPKEQLGPTNALLRTIQEVGGLVAPVVGTVLYVSLGAPSVVLLDAATFLICAALVAAVRVTESAVPPRTRSWRAEMTVGLTHVWHTPALRYVVVAMGGALLVFGFFESVIFAVIDQGLHRSAAFYGVITTVKGIGSVSGGLWAMRLSKRLAGVGDAWLTVIGLALLATGSAVMLLPNTPAVLLGALIIGVGIPMAIIGLFTVAQHNTPQELQGRVSGSASTLVTTPQVVSVAVGAALVSHVNYNILLTVIAVVIFVSAGYLAVHADSSARTAETVGGSGPDNG